LGEQRHEGHCQCRVRNGFARCDLCPALDCDATEPHAAAAATGSLRTLRRIQRDTDGDGIGNVCDADLDDNCNVD
jgi:hypothetical protein